MATIEVATVAAFVRQNFVKIVIPTSDLHLGRDGAALPQRPVNVRRDADGERARFRYLNGCQEPSVT